MSEDTGASNNERLLHAAKQDDDELAMEIFRLEDEKDEEDDDFDVNYADGLGNTALHYAAKNGSINVMELILEQEGCDVDPLNRMDRATPLHLACRIEDEETRYAVVSSLLDAGANMNIRDKFGSLAVDLLPGKDEKTRTLFRSTQATNAISHGDIAEDSDDGEPGSGSDED